MHYWMKAERGNVNFLPVGFCRAAEDFLSCYDSYKPSGFSVVQFFLCGRAIELALKAIHLQTETQLHVKQNFSHDLKASYDALPMAKKILASSELQLLERVSVLYQQKRFEYVQPSDAATAYTDFPDLDDLARLTRKLVLACR